MSLLGTSERWEQGLAGDGALRLVVETRQEPGPFAAVAWSADGRFLAAAGAGRVKLWDIRGDTTLRTLAVQGAAVEAIAFAPDGDRLVAGTLDGRLVAWNLATGEVQHAIDAYSSGVQVVQFDRAGGTLMTSNRDGAIDIRDGHSLRGRRSVQGPADSHGIAALSPDGRRLIVVEDERMSLVNAETGRRIRGLSGHDVAVSMVAFSPDGRAIASGDVSGGVRVWSVSAGAAIRTLAPSTSIERRPRERRRRKADEILSLEWDPRGTRVVAGTVGGRLLVWKPTRQKPLVSVDAFAHYLWGIAFSPDSTVLATAGGLDRAIKLWRLLRGRTSGLAEVGSIIALGESDWAAVTPDDTFEASPGGERHLFWLGADRDPSPLAARPGQRRSNLVPGLLTAGGAVEARPATVRPDRARRPLQRPATEAAREPAVWLVTTPPAPKVPSITVRTNPAHGIASVAVSVDGSLVASGSEDMSIQLWDPSLGREIRTLRGHTDIVTSLAFLGDKALLASGSRDGTVRVWDVQSGQLVDRIPIGLAAAPVTVTRSADGKLLVCASHDGTIRMVHTGTGRVLHTSRIFEEDPSGQSFIMGEQVAVSPDARIAVRPHHRDIVTVLDLATGKVLYEFRTHDTPGSLAFDRRGRRFAVGGATSRQMITLGGGSREPETDTGYPLHTYRIELRASADGRLQHNLLGHRAKVTALAFSPTGDLLGSGSEDGTVRLWDTRSGKERARLETGSTSVNSLAFDGLGLTITSGERTPPFSGRLTAWQVGDGRVRTKFERPIGDVNPVCFSPDGRSIAAGGEDGHIRLWTLDRQAGPRLLRGHRERVFSLEFAPDGRHLVSASWDGTSRLWDAASGESIALFDEDAPRLWHATFSRDGRLLAICRQDGDVSVWQMSPRRRRFVLRRGNSRQNRPAMTDVAEAALSASFSPDGQVLAVAYGDDQVVLWEVATGRHDRAFDAHPLGATSVRYDESGTRLVTGGLDQTVGVWNARTGRLLHRLTGHASPGHIEKGTSARFASDGSLIASGGTDGTIRLWDAASGRAVSAIEAHAGAIASVAFAPFGHVLAAASNDASVSVWDVRVPDQPAKRCALYAFADGSWAVVDAHGRYDASDGGRIEWLHWVVGLDIVALDQLKERYYEPGLLAKVFGFSADELRDVPALAAVSLPPEVRRSALDADGVRSLVRLHNRGGGIGRVEVLLNGKEVRADARGEVFDAQSALHEIEVELSRHPFLVPAGDNTCTVRAYNAEGYLVGPGVSWKVAGPKLGSRPPSLWAIVAGASGYSSPSLQLRFAAKDAEDVATAMRLASGGLFTHERVHLRLLTSPYQAPAARDAGGPAAPVGVERPTRQRLAAAFEEAKAAVSTDILVVYLAGHGVNYGGADGDYFFLTPDARTSDLTDPAVRRQTAVSSRELTEWIRAVPALKQVLVLDTCAAGRFVESLSEHRALPSSQQRAFERMKDRTGIHILAGSTADAVSYESSQYGQGLLTYSLLLGMRGAALRDDEFVDVARLFAYATDAVPRLAAYIGGIQRPLTSTPRGGASFDIGRVGGDEREQIPMASVRPLVLRAEFEETASWRDAHGLGRAVNGLLREESARGRAASLIFIDAAEYPGAYQVKGRYATGGNAINVQVRVMRGADIVLDTALDGSANAPDHLAGRIAAEAVEAVRSHFGGRHAPA
jgi:WD40 repeat protein/uncharacterized caspase-like protein